MVNFNEPFTTSAKLLIPTSVKEKGVEKKVYPPYNEGIDFNCEVKSYGGTNLKEKDNNGVLVVVDTITVNTWYHPQIKSDCRIALSEDKVYDVIGEPENINNRNRQMKFMAQRRHGAV